MFNRLVLLLVTVVVSACGSSSGEEFAPDLAPAVNSSNVPQFVVPVTANGFFLASETVTFQNGDVF